MKFAKYLLEGCTSHILTLKFSTIKLKSLIVAISSVVISKTLGLLKAFSTFVTNIPIVRLKMIL